MTAGQQLELEQSEIAKVEQATLEKASGMLERMAKHACNCDGMQGVHEENCASLVMLRCAHAVLMRAEPQK